MKTGSRFIPPQPSTAVLHAIKVAARVSLGFVWVWEGIVPKILYPSDVQIEMVRRSGLSWGDGSATLRWLGFAMIVAGLAIMSGIRERLAVLVATIAVLILMVLVIVNHPPAITDPFGGLAKDACLFASAAVVWWLAPLVPKRPTHST